MVARFEVAVGQATIDCNPMTATKITINMKRARPKAKPKAKAASSELPPLEDVAEDPDVIDVDWVSADTRAEPETTQNTGP